MLSSFLFLISLLNVSGFHLPQSRTSYSRVRIQDEVRTRINNQYQYQQQLHQYVNKLLVHRSSPTDNFWRIDEDTSELDCESSTGLARKREEEARKKKEEEAKAEALRIENERLAAERLAAAAALKAAADAAAALEKESVVANTVNKVIESSSIADKAVIVSSDANSITGSGSSSNDITKLTPGNNNSAFDVGLIILFPVMIGTLLIFLLFPFIGKQLADSLPPPS
jgi:hypothetical protein